MRGSSSILLNLWGVLQSDFVADHLVQFYRHYVLHDWPDETCLKILANIKDAMRPKYSKLLIAEFVVASKGADPFNTALDITVMTVVGAKERTEEDWKKLIEKAGLQIVEINSLPGDHESVIEVGLVGES